ncbi:MAG: hypothetical protein FIB02_12220 [Desulfuromonas sp.]|nr:hypothetical protein [Desulfuromonas sp.]
MNWSLPDQDGIVTYQLSVGAVSTLRGRRKRKGITPRFFDLDLWPDSWKKVLSLWVKQVGNRRKWMSMLKAAGQRYVNEAGSVVEALLKAGLIEVEERRDKGSWQLQWIEFLDLEKVREQLGLPNREHLEVVKNAQSNCLVECPELEGLKDSLVTMPAERAIRRHELVIALDRWVAEECNGTRRDFAYFARGDTKALTDSEWSWLENHVSLEHLGISRHVPAVWLRAPITLFFNGGRLDLRAIQDFIGLTPYAFVQLNANEGEVRSWRLLENRTVFE